MQAQYSPSKGFFPVFFNIILKLWTRSIVVAPVALRCNSSPLDSFIFTSRLSFLPKILSPNVLSSVLDIGNVIHKTVKVPNKVPTKHAAVISPGIGVLR